MKIYVCELSEKEQSEIKKLATTQLKSLAYAIDLQEEIENAMNSKISDISELIGITKYL